MENLLNLIQNNRKFDEYYTQLIEYNEKVNLTAITEREEVFIKHFYDSCLGADFIPHNATVVDIGTGAGFPGLPLKIIRPDIDLHLVDSLNKRVVFLNELKSKLDINFSTYHSRAEEFASSHREQFDVCVSRAVAKLSTLLEYCLPLVKVGGVLIAYKGASSDEEIKQSANALNILGGEVYKIYNTNLPNDLGERNLIIIKKIKSCSKEYPRNKNLPKIKPL